MIWKSRPRNRDRPVRFKLAAARSRQRRKTQTYQYRYTSETNAEHHIRCYQTISGLDKVIGDLLNLEQRGLLDAPLFFTVATTDCSQAVRYGRQIIARSGLEDPLLRI